MVEEFTKAEETKYKIKFNNFQINFFKTLSKFEKYDTIETEKQIKIFSNFYLPIDIIKITNKEKIEKKITYGIEEAKQIGVEIASKNIEEELTRRLWGNSKVYKVQRKQWFCNGRSNLWSFRKYRYERKNSILKGMK